MNPCNIYIYRYIFNSSCAALYGLCRFGKSQTLSPSPRSLWIPPSRIDAIICSVPDMCFLVASGDAVFAHGCGL